ncbi:MAG: endonuclease [Verrucomicrobiales bacterium]
MPTIGLRHSRLKVCGTGLAPQVCGLPCRGLSACVEFVSAFLFFVAPALAAAGEPPAYYSIVEGKSGTALRNALHQRICPHSVIPYSSSEFDTGDALRVLDESSNESTAVRLVYSGLDAPKPNLNGTDGWNREHVWPNTCGLENSEAGHADLHNLRACDATVNSVCGNSAFDESIRKTRRGVASTITASIGQSVAMRARRVRNHGLQTVTGILPA